MLPYTPDWDHVSTANGYKVVRCVGHPKAWKKGSYVYVHVVVAEWKLGRLLQDTEVAHHEDENKLNNSPENIKVKTRGDHTRGHNKLPKYSTLVCKHCGKKFERLQRFVRNPEYAFCSKRCAGYRPESKHGTASAYGYRRCRCRICKDAHAKRQRELRKKSAPVV